MKKLERDVKLNKKKKKKKKKKTLSYMYVRMNCGMRGSRNFHERGSNENGNFWSQARGGGGCPTLKKSRNYLFLGKIYFQNNILIFLSSLFGRKAGGFTFEPLLQLKTNNLHIRNQRHRSASQLISVLLFATCSVQFLNSQNSNLSCPSLAILVCVGPGRKLRLLVF